ncbi:nucleotide pyrophosphohydrolase [Bradyrhizobium zhanjiangense]|uniref:Nucleotide pyrophosphohydrolase n=1 Tax=Bradyrhizobium zhanjiangense TaxID=1325107 RepID=A0A4Q0QAK8_9BRAD|nr:nucleotide pyrophosphohydrolase [Bradyrhizobium zhanjiangense]RXG86541.1 nucleotide pyrophosphohydrolase [Bradyrhizobium zhanjiangense]
MEEIVKALRQFRDDRNWSRFHTPKDLAISVSIEAGELLEIFQWQHDGHDLDGLDRSRVAAEAADVLLYTLMLFDRLGLDPTAEAMRKIRLNAQRYPVEKTFDKPASFLKALK